MDVEIKIIGEIDKVETICVGSSIREIDRIRKLYGQGRWRKLKGNARVQLPDRAVCRAEVHWYEAHGIGKKEIKIKRVLGFE